jgi:hypothetical protein
MNKICIIEKKQVVHLPKSKPNHEYTIKNMTDGEIIVCANGEENIDDERFYVMQTSGQTLMLIPVPGGWTII